MTVRPVLCPNPALTSGNIDLYVSDRMRTGGINVYSAFVLSHEAVRIHRASYLLPAWGRRLGISGLLRLYLDSLLAKALGCDHEARQAKEWFLNDRAFLQERRPHFLSDRLSMGEALFEDQNFYALLSKLRTDYEQLSDDDGPFPDEVFPYHHAAPERELLEPGSQPGFADKELDEETSEIYVEICTET